jgi:hypothetical protein
VADRVKRPAFQFYPGDWRRDTALQSCSIAARGLWIEMITHMHESDPYGYLTAGGVPLTTQGLANLTGLTVAVAKRLLAELEEKKVFSRDDSGTIYSRRMVRDEDIRTRRASGGKLGGNPALVGGKDKTEVPRRLTSEDNQNPTPATATASTASASAEELPPLPEPRVRFCAAANKGLEQHPTRPQLEPRVLPNSGKAYEATDEILAAGVPADFAESAIYDIARSHDAEGQITSLKYFTGGVLRLWRKQGASHDMRRSSPGALPTTNGNGTSGDILDRWARGEVTTRG